MTVKLKENEYQCAKCEGIFKYGQSEEKALQEKEMLFPEVPIEDCAIICDDCFKIIFNQ